MFEYFFYHYSMLPENSVGFKLYDRLHLTWLVSLLIMIILISISYRRLSTINKDKFKKIMAVIMIGLEIIKDIIIASSGNFGWGHLPLHLCGISLFVILFHAYSKKTFWAEMAYVICLPGALAALLFADWTVYPLMNFMHIHSFIIHAMIILYPILLLVGREYRPNYRYLFRVLGFVSLLALPIYVFNKIFDTNFFFINWPSLGSPLVLFEKWMGNPGYLIPLAILLFVVVMLMYMPFYLKDKILDYKVKEN